MSTSDYNKILGRRLRNFRKRAGLSQMEMELEIGASSGYLSRVENGEVNPTKESLDRMSKALGLNEREMSYLYGSLFYPATQEEINEARKSVDEYFRKKGTLAYLIDDRKRLIDLSDTFHLFLNLPKSICLDSLLKPFVTVLLDPRIQLRDRLSTESFDQVVSNYLLKFYVDNYFMQDDISFQRSLLSISDDEFASKIWKSICVEKPALLQTNDKRFVVFNYKGMDIKLNFSIQYLLENRRFEIIEYTPTSELLRLLSKILS